MRRQVSESGPTRRRARGGAARTLGLAFRTRPFTVLALLLAALYLPWIGAIPLDGTLEGNRLEAAREMLHSGDWLVPRLGGEVYLAKPPLHPWTLALAALPVGELRLDLGRGLSAVATIAACCLVFAWGRRELGTRTGAFAALALGGAVLCAEKAVRAELESELMLFTALALFLLWRAGRSRGREAAFASVACGLALGAALLVKGPPALIVFLAAALPVCTWREERRSFAVPVTLALVLGLACALAWVVPVCARLGLDQVRRALDEQFLERIAHAGRTNAEPFWFYVPALLVGLLPATLFLPGLVLVRPGRPGESERGRGRAAYLWGWALFALIAFSFSSGKETRYLLPTLPAWALLLAWGWTRARVSLRFVPWRRGLVRALEATTWLAPLAWVAAGWRLYPQHFAVVIRSATIALLARAAFAWSARSGRPIALVGSLVVSILAAKLGWGGTVLSEQQREVPVAAIGREIAARLAPSEPWILVGPYRSWWQFAVNRPCVSVGEWAELPRAGGPAHYALAPAQAIPADEALERVDSWSVDGETYCLVRL
jgi:4-amino-4-deoxy-L-arabinose transferase-like glycosyltransferase